MKNETAAPEGMRVYNIVSIAKENLAVEGPDKWWLEAAADDGTVIALGNLSEGVYEVLVQGPHEPDGRHYRGGLGSPAHERFERYLRLYEEAAAAGEPLDDPQGAGGES